MKNYRVKIVDKGEEFITLADILPESGKLDILFIAKTPAIVSVEAGHYFQGRQGTMFWNRLLEYDIIKFPKGKFADDYLLDNNCGITDIVKVPRNYGFEPTDEEYKQGMDRVLETIEKYSPKVIVFVYKGVLDNILRLKFGVNLKSKYGFNPELDKYFGSKVFVFPMPGTPCTKAMAVKSMNELKAIIKK